MFSRFGIKLDINDVYVYLYALYYTLSHSTVVFENLKTPRDSGFVFFLNAKLNLNLYARYS
jgi:hypothetical protein